MEPKLIDHALALLLAFVAPIQGRREYRRLLSAPQPQGRRRAWIHTILNQWGVSTALIVWWLFTDRPLSALAITPVTASAGYAIGAGVFLLATGFFLYQLAAVRRGGRARDSARAQLAPIQALLPHDTRELRLFSAVAMTAGICEELLYRGFLFWYLERFGGTLFAVLVSSLIFGVGHVYQGASSILKTGVAGLAMAGLRVLTGSLWVPMAIHGAVDLLGGWTAHAALGQAETPLETPAPR